MILAVVAALAASQSAACTPPPGAERLWALEQTRFIVVGETHGTTEIPAAFAEVVCAAAEDRSITVGVEFEDDVQAELDRWMASDGGPQARAEFLSHITWTRRFQDGRSSIAMWDMIDRLRVLKAQGRDIAVVAFRPTATRPRSFGQAYGELGMAQSLSLMAQARPDALNLILVGNVHAAKADNGRFRPASSLLPPHDVVAITAASEGGEAWVCAGEPEPGQPPESICRPSAMDGTDRGTRGIVMRDSGDGAFDGLLSVGPTTASPPAVSR